MADSTPKYPEHEKLKAIKHESWAIGEFITEMGSLGLTLAVWRHDSELVMCNETTNSILARYFKIDLKKLEKEKDQMLEEQRQAE